MRQPHFVEREQQTDQVPEQISTPDNHLRLLVLQSCEKLQLLKVKADKFLQNAIFSAYTMTNLINDLLDLAKMNNAAFQLHLENCNLVEIVEKTFHIIAHQATEKNISLHLSLQQS